MRLELPDINHLYLAVHEHQYGATPYVFRWDGDAPPLADDEDAVWLAEQLKLAVVRSPIDFPPMRFYQLWHERSHRSQAHRWLRERLTQAASRLRASAS